MNWLFALKQNDYRKAVHILVLHFLSQVPIGQGLKGEQIILHRSIPAAEVNPLQVIRSSTFVLSDSYSAQKLLLSYVTDARSDTLVSG